ncbi:MAG: TorD/DmsD family molecular chaperone [Limnochordia bacterium]
MLAEELYLKSVLYDLLARGFDYPDDELAASLTTSNQEESFLWRLGQAAALLGEGALAENLEAMDDFISTYSEPEDLLLELQKDYTRACFASRPRLVPLFESVYKEGKLLQDSTFQVARLYYEAGLQAEQKLDLPPDHIAVELEFMSYLCLQHFEALQKGEDELAARAEELQRELLDNHLLEFATSFAARFQEHGRTPFYRNLASCLAKVMDWERQAS